MPDPDAVPRPARTATIEALTGPEGSPPFERLRTQIARRAAQGELLPGTRLPTVRALAEQLALSPGTVARAYRELEADKVVITEGRRGTFVAASTSGAGQGARSTVASYVAALRALGIGREEAHRLLDEVWTTGPPPRSP